MTPRAHDRSRPRRPSLFRPRLQALEDRTTPTGTGWVIDADPEGHVFLDANTNGVFDAGEAGVSGWTVWLDLNTNGVLDQGEPAQATDDTGHYSFDTTNIPPAFIGSDGRLVDIVRFDLQVGSGGRWVNTTSTDVLINRTATPWATGVDFGVIFQPAVGVAPQGPESPVNATTAGQQLGTDSGVSVSADAAGNYVVAWGTFQADGSVTAYARVFNADGSPRTGEILVGTGTGSTPTVAMAGNGGFLVAWASLIPGSGLATTGGSLFARAYRADGTPAGGQVTVLAATSTQVGHLAGVAADGTGNFAVLYSTEKYNKVWGWGGPTFKMQRYTASGSASGSVITVATPTLANGRGSIAMDAAGNSVVVWDDYSNGTVVYAQRYSATGRKAGGQITVASGPGVIWQSSVAMNATGRFVVAWCDRNSGTKRAQVYNPDGTPAGATVTFGVGAEPESQAGVAMDSAGNVTFTWTSRIPRVVGQSSSYDTTEVRMQRLTAAGVLEPVTIVNTTTQGSQSGPGVAATGDGRFVVVWAGYGPGDDQGIFAQQYAPLP
jgi:hypothetical protein